MSTLISGYSSSAGHRRYNGTESKTARSRNKLSIATLARRSRSQRIYSSNYELIFHNIIIRLFYGNMSVKHVCRRNVLIYIIVKGEYISNLLKKQIGECEKNGEKSAHKTLF